MRWWCRGFRSGSGQRRPLVVSSPCCPPRCWTLTSCRHTAVLESLQSCSCHTLVSTVWGGCTNRGNVYRPTRKEAIKKTALISVSRWPFWLNKLTAFLLSYVSRNLGTANERDVFVLQSVLFGVCDRGAVMRNASALLFPLPLVFPLGEVGSTDSDRRHGQRASKHNTQELVQTHLRRLQRIPLFEKYVTTVWTCKRHSQEMFC